MALQRFTIILPRPLHAGDQNFGPAVSVIIDSSQELTVEWVQKILSGFQLGTEGSDEGITVFKEERTLPLTLEEFIMGVGRRLAETFEDDALSPQELAQETREQKQQRHGKQRLIIRHTQSKINDISEKMPKRTL